MIELPQFLETSAEVIARLHVVVPREQIQAVMGPSLAELTEAVRAQNIPVTGPWFTHHFRRPGETFDFEICFPVAREVAPVGRVQPGYMPAAKVVRTIYHGGYDGLAAAWGEFHQWIEAHGHAVGEELWERYLAGPETGTEPSQWRTELIRPLLP